MKAPVDPFHLGALRELAEEPPLAALRTWTEPEFLESLNHGDLPRWLASLARLPAIEPGRVDLQTGVSVGTSEEAGERQGLIEALLREFIPWRKGPFSVFGVQVDSEWQCGMKWDRVTPHLSPLAGRRVLDVGCGNGYYCWRALGEGARLVIGLEPYLLYVMQFLAIRHYLPRPPCFVLPLRLEDFTGPFHYFDTVFSMGVIYHVRSPIDHLLQLKKCLAPGGQLVLETLVVDGVEGYSLTPPTRYARMSNVWFVPSDATLLRWLQRCGFTDIRLVDSTPTRPEEQRSTLWMPFQSLIDGLDPDDPSLTCEGLPAPRRSIVIASSEK